MASNYTSEFSFYNGKRWARGYVEAWVSSQTDTTATIYWRIVCQQKSAALYGQEANGYVDGSYVGYCSGWLGSSSTSYSNVCEKSGYVTVNKTSGARSVPVTISTRVTPIDGYGSVTTSWYSATCYVSIAGITIYAPNAPSGLTNTRDSDTKNTLNWTAPTVNATHPVTAVLIERSVDGGEWSQIASVSATATNYADTTTSADHYYRYRIMSQNGAGTSSYATSGYTYNTPAAPTKVTASRLAETTVKLAIENAARTATALDVQRSTDGEEWQDVSSPQGSPVTEATDSPGGGTFYYRARNTRGDLKSAWSAASNAVVTITPPNAPTLKAPASGIVVNKAQDVITFEWLHEPIDGSAQTAAELRYSLDDGASWEVIEVSGNGASYGLSNAFAVNSTVTWGVRTKGAHEDFGPWSGNRTFKVYQEPTVAFAQPADGFVVENTPITIQLQYEDPSGDLVSAALAISDGSKVVWSRTVTSLSYEITSDEWVPDNESAYYATVEVRSSSSLTASASRTFTTAFVPPVPAGASVENDVETGFARLSIYLKGTEDSEPFSITWDGDTTGLFALGNWIKVSNLTPSLDDVLGQEYIGTATNGDSSSFEITSDVTADLSTALGIPASGYVVGTGTAIVVFLEDFTADGVTATAGVYFSDFRLTGSNWYVSELTLPGNGLAEPKSISVWREVNGERVLLGEGLQAGAGLVDRYAPINVDYRYVVVSVADSGAVSTTYVPARIDSQWFYFIWGDNVAKGRTNPEGTKKLTRPNRRRRHLAGRPSPVSFDDGSVSDTRSVSVLLRTKAEADAFDQMMWESARCVYKSADGDVLHADVELSDKPAWVMPTYYGSVSVSLTRIDGRVL